MRLFTAIGFDSATRQGLLRIQQDLRQVCVKGNFTALDNLHLTLVFLGETDRNRIPEIIQAMDGVSVPPFSVSFNTVGFFKRNGRDIWWIVPQRDETLFGLYTALSSHLGASGFSMDRSVFIPHLTLAREVLLRDTDNQKNPCGSISPITTWVHSFSLMESSRMDGKLTYTPLI
ncbi:MAG: RNA 2',3'-cyclic phosphodiesterase [Sphaerochaetaceae bacterium]